MEASMTILGAGADTLVALMRRDRVRDLDTSWLLFGPEGAPAEAGGADEPSPFLLAAE